MDFSGSVSGTPCGASPGLAASAFAPPKEPRNRSGIFRLLRDRLQPRRVPPCPLLRWPLREKQQEGQACGLVSDRTGFAPLALASLGNVRQTLAISPIRSLGALAQGAPPFGELARQVWFRQQVPVPPSRSRHPSLCHGWVDSSRGVPPDFAGGGPGYDGLSGAPGETLHLCSRSNLFPGRPLARQDQLQKGLTARSFQQTPLVQAMPVWG